jgi:hypothetical protein
VSQDGELDPSLTALDLVERGFVLGSTVLRLGPDGAAPLTAPAQGHCTAALKTLARAPRDKKIAHIAQLARELGAPFPPAVEIGHPSWLRGHLDVEPSDLLPALIAGAPPALRSAAGEVMQSRRGQGDDEPAAAATLSPELAAELRRVVFAPLRHVFASASGPMGALLGRSSQGALFEMRRLGARSLGASLASSPSVILARAMAVVGDSFASDLRQAAESVDDASRREAEADVKAAASDPATTAEERLERIGFQALRRFARGASTEVKRALALRLPRNLGEQLLAEEVAPGADSPPTHA